MIHEKNTLRRDLLPPFARNFLTEDMLLFDIETTGLSPDRGTIYCIGCGFAQGEELVVELFLAEQAEEEPQLLSSFLRLAASHSTFLTFNGTTFDFPFLERRAEFFSENGEDADPDGILPSAARAHIDLYREAKSMRKLLELSSYRQKSIEQFLGCEREDIYSGGQLIAFYRDYVKTKSQELLDPILLHNREDVAGMFLLLEVLAFRQFRNGRYEITGLTEEGAGEERFLNIKLRPEQPLPQSIHRLWEDSAILLDRESALVRFPIRHGILKHFFDDPENYYYLPEEDTAVHKSVGQFVDSSHRIRATKTTCYVKKECDYLALPIKTMDSFLKRSRDEKDFCLEMPPDPAELKVLVTEYFALFT